jgi:hypothetical protein
MNTPETGFYYHYKHNPNESVNNYSYEVISVGTHTETGEKCVIYRSLYQTETQDSGTYWLRPLEMFMEHVTKDGKTFPRFQLISDTDTISKLAKIGDEMYSQK